MIARASKSLWYWARTRASTGPCCLAAMPASRTMPACGIPRAIASSPKSLSRRPPRGCPHEPGRGSRRRRDPRTIRRPRRHRDRLPADPHVHRPTRKRRAGASRGRLGHERFNALVTDDAPGVDQARPDILALEPWGSRGRASICSSLRPSAGHRARVSDRPSPMTSPAKQLSPHPFTMPNYVQRGVPIAR